MKATKSEKLYILDLLKELFKNNSVLHFEIVVSKLNYMEHEEIDPDRRFYDLIRSDTKEKLYTFYWTPCEYRIYLKWRYEEDE